MRKKQHASDGSGTRPGVGTPEDVATAPAEALSRNVFERELKKLQIELVDLQEWVKHAGLKLCIVFEGRDGAGKGGVINAIANTLNPRACRVVAV
jgi:polyphosphate kinase 2 (PPK2 family)